jgi:hypothetical protein
LVISVSLCFGLDRQIGGQNWAIPFLQLAAVSLAASHAERSYL